MKRLLSIVFFIILALTVSSALVACGHEHSFEQEWTKDEYYHWHAADCRHEEVSAHEPHSMGEGRVENGKTVYTCTVCDYAVNDETLASKPISVSLAHRFAPRDARVLVEGYFVGVSDGAGNNREQILLKDTESDALIAVRGLPRGYGNWPSIGYQKGDKVRILVTVKDEFYRSSKEDSQNRRYLLFAEENGELASTVVSRANAVSYELDAVTVLQSHKDFKEFFKIGEIQAYSYVRIKGYVYLNAYGGGGEFRPHMNGAATKESEAMPDGQRAVGFREEALVANIGTAWEDYFLSEWVRDSVGTSVGRAQEVDIIAVYTGASENGFHLTVLDADWMRTVSDKEEIQTNQDIVREMALSYLRKGGLLEYDQYNGRRMVFATPEEATAQSYVFLDCSSYVTSVYYNTFALKAIPDSYGSQNTKNYTRYARENYGKVDYPDVVAYYETLQYTTKEQQQECLNQVRALLQPGDILVYRRGSKNYGANYSEDNLTGHAILYMGDGMFTHSTGTSWNDGGTEAKRLYKDNPELGKDRATTEEYYNGTVQWLSADSVLSIGTKARALFGEKSTFIYNFSIIRPLARKGASLNLSEQAQKRMAMPGLSFDKITSAGIGSAVCRGSEITYTLTVKNYGANAYTGLAFEEALPEGVTLVSSSISLSQSGSKLTGTIDIGAYQTATVTWTVKVGQSLPAGTVLCNQTAVGGLKMKAIENTVSGYTAAELSAIAAAARAYAESGATFADPMEFVSAVYTEALGFDPFSQMTAEQMQSALFGTNASSKTVVDLNGAFGAMIAPNLYGGAELYSSTMSGNNKIVRTVYAHQLTAGDVIFCEWQGNFRVLIYLGEGALAALDSLSLTCSLKQNGSEQWSHVSGRYVQDHYLASLFSYEKFVVMRPSHIAQ